MTGECLQAQLSLLVLAYLNKQPRNKSSWLHLFSSPFLLALISTDARQPVTRSLDVHPFLCF